jgi:hypothetical protein
MRPDLDGGAGPFQYALCDHELAALNRQDDELWAESCKQQSADPAPCRSGLRRFHIDAYGRLQLCSGNRAHGYDLRTGSFRQGFFEALPTFACEWKAPASPDQAQTTVSHA